MENIQAWMAGLLADHPGYRWNRDGNRIKCNGAECGHIMDSDAESASAVFANHQAQALKPVELQLEALRTMRLRAARFEAHLPVDHVPTSVLADLSQILVETALDIRNGHAQRLAGSSDESVYDELDTLPPVRSLPDAAPEPGAAVAEAAAAEDHSVPPAAEAALPEPAKAPATVAALDWMGELPEITSATTEAPARKPRKKKEWTPKQTVPVFDEDNRAVMASVVAGDRVRARFMTEMDGDFTIEATVIAGAAGMSLVAGSMVISAGGEPGRHLHSVTVLESAGDPAFTPSTEPEHFGLSA